MGRIRLEIVNPAGTLRQSVEVPDDRAVSQVAQAIAQKMEIQLPVNGRFLLMNKSNNAQILDNSKTLEAQGIVDGTVLQFQVDRDAGALLSPVWRVYP